MRTVKAPQLPASQTVPGVTGPAAVGSELDIGLMLQVRRCQLGLSQADVARRSKLRQPRVSFLERNPGRATVAELLGLCTALGLELSAKKVAVPAAQ